MLREKSKAGPEKCVKGLKAEIARVRLWCTFFSLGREKRGSFRAAKEKLHQNPKMFLFRSGREEEGTTKVLN